MERLDKGVGVERGDRGGEEERPFVPSLHFHWAIQQTMEASTLIFHSTFVFPSQGLIDYACFYVRGMIWCCYTEFGKSI